MTTSTATRDDRWPWRFPLTRPGENTVPVRMRTEYLPAVEKDLEQRGVPADIVEKCFLELQRCDELPLEPRRGNRGPADIYDDRLGARTVRPSGGRRDVRAGHQLSRRGPSGGLKASARPPCRPAGRGGPPLLPKPRPLPLRRARARHRRSHPRRTAGERPKRCGDRGCLDV